MTSVLLLFAHKHTAHDGRFTAKGYVTLYFHDTRNLSQPWQEQSLVVDPGFPRGEDANLLV